MARAIDLIYDKLTHRNFRRLEERHTVIEWLDPGPASAFSISVAATDSMTGT